MARSNRGGVFGLIRGSVGPATYSIGKTTNGKKLQIVREKPTEIANPRTRAQALQRMKLKPIFFAQQLMRDIVDHSFQGVENGQPSLRHFLSLAMKENDIPYINRGSAETAIGGYIVSSGDLGEATSRVRENANSFDQFSFSKLLPVCSFQVVDPELFGENVSASNYDGTYSSLIAWLLAKSYCQCTEGQEVAVLTFIMNSVGSSRQIKMRKIRALMNSNYSSETSSTYAFPGGSAGTITVPSNVCQALCEYNPEYATEIIALAKALYAAATVPAEGTDADKILAVQVASDFKLFCYVLGLTGGAFIGDDVAGNGVCGWTGSAAVTRSAEILLPQSANEAAADGAVAAVALIVSEKVNNNWHFTNSDICLTKGYRDLVNSDIRFENAIASYMTEAGDSNTTSDKFLHLEEYGFDLRQSVFTIRYRQDGQVRTAQVIGGANVNPDESNVLFTTTTDDGTFICAPGNAFSYPINVDWLIDDDFLLVDFSEVSY